MNDPWIATLRPTTHELRILVRTRETGDLMQARLPARSAHPRAVLTLLEGLSLFRGQPMRAVICVAAPSPTPYDLGLLFGDELWPGESPLVQFDFELPVRRRGRLRGLGDFRALRNAVRGGAL
ncbi:MAG TPA: hypothetical protein VNO21_14365 [Polyangiaceae bacterium]|nr:hypothetical protein [Polyangiaceae bacterium]